MKKNTMEGRRDGGREVKRKRVCGIVFRAGKEKSKYLTKNYMIIMT